MSGAKNLKKGEILFREGDASDAMFVIKTGRIAITKTKGFSEIVLAELGPGDMLGEMAFFDSKPRSAGAKAIADTVVIELPFKSLNAQFKTFPEWLKAIVRTVNTHLRNANTKIKNLEKVQEDETQAFTPHLVTRLMAVLCLVASRFGEKEGKDGKDINVPPNRLRNYCIQVFQQPTAKLQKLMEMLAGFGYMKIEEIGEGRQKLTIFKLDMLMNFVDYYNDWIFTSEDKKISIEEKEMKAIDALIKFGQKEKRDAKGIVKVNLTNLQNESMKVLGHLFSVDDVDPLVTKGLSSEKMSGEGGIFVSFDLNNLETIYPYWEMIHAFRKATRD
jgi:CRP-like cAMP-binding protein